MPHAYLPVVSVSGPACAAGGLSLLVFGNHLKPSPSPRVKRIGQQVSAEVWDVLAPTLPFPPVSPGRHSGLYRTTRPAPPGKKKRRRLWISLRNSNNRAEARLLSGQSPMRNNSSVALTSKKPGRPSFV